MKFSTKLPAIYSKRVTVRAVKRDSSAGVTVDRVPDGKKHGFKSFFIKPLGQVRTAATEAGNSDVSGGDSVAKKIAKRRINVSKPVSSTAPVNSQLDFPQLLKVLPSDIKKSFELNFPLLNPWRLEGFEAPLEGTEEDVQIKRAKLLASTFPVSQFPSVSKILQSTQSDTAKENLTKWKASKVEELGEVGFIEYQRQLFGRGSILHRYIAHRLQSNSNPPKIAEEVEGFWASLQPILPNISDVKMLEKHITHPFLCYKGVADCVATYQGELILIDWKTSSRPKPSLAHLYDEPLQAAAYLGAFNYDKSIKYQLQEIALIIAYESGEPAEVHRLTHSHCRDYWKLWLARLKKYWDTL